MLYEANPQSSNSVRIIGWIVTGAVSLLLLAVLSSLLLQNESPADALRLNPLNSEARVQLAISLFETNETGAPERAKPVLLRGISFSPSDARFLSLLGVYEHQTGDTETANLLFTEALDTLPTEFQALAHKAVYAVSEGDFASAALFSDMIARRWTAEWNSIEPVVVEALNDRDGFESFATRFADYPRSREVLVKSLTGNAYTLPQAYKLLATWNSQGIPDLEPLNDLLMRRLLNEEQFGLAYSFHRQTASPRMIDPDNLVNNGDFRFEPSRGVFDWSLKAQAGVGFEWSTESPAPATPSNQQAKQSAGRLVIQFLDSPVRFKNVKQSLLLTPGNYLLSVTFSTHELRAPEPLKIAVECIGSGVQLAELEFSESDSAPSTILAANFSVPSETCPTQEIYIFNELQAESWSNRYQGKLALERVAIEYSEN